MRIIIEVEGTPQQQQVNVTPPSASQQIPGAAQPSIGGAIDAGPAPTSPGAITMTGVNVRADGTAPIVAEPGENSAGVAPNLSAN